MFAYVFPGQGSQMRGMGGDLFDEFSELVKSAETILGYSLKTLCLEDPEQKLNQTQYTQPALYTVNALMYFKKIKETQQKPDFVAGHSLGEYNALLAAEVFDYVTGLKLVKKRGELMSLASGGSMAAIIGLKINEIQDILRENQLSNITIANYNTYTQFVISGTQNEIEQAKSHFKNAKYIPLKVSGAFHSPLMSSAQKEFAEFLKQFEFATPVIPVLSNLNADIYHPAVIKHNLINQITHSVKWTSIIEYLLKKNNLQIQEIGPGNVLSRLIQQIQETDK